MNPETFTFSGRPVPLVDTAGVAIREGSVIRHKDGTAGVVLTVVREGDPAPALAARVGDLVVYTSAGCHRVSNQYSNWTHVPHNQQTYEQRYLSWARTPYVDAYDASLTPHLTRDEARLVDGIMALLPDDAINHAHGPFADSVQETLSILASHLTKLTEQE